jgi:hypothetical protein
MIWYHPSWCGDFRLVPENGDEDKSRLIVTDPTPAEIQKLGAFLVKARKKGWVPNLAGVADRGDSTLLIDAPVAKAGKLLLGWRARKDILTAVKSYDGEITPVIGNGDEVEKAVEKKDTKEAATVKRPTLCCPTPVSGPDIRASEVLRAFSTNKQWKDWLKHGHLIAYGKLTGHPYRICHRHTPLAQQQGKIAWDLHDDAIVHCYDWSVPPAEEVLAVKLVLEHAEHWIRNKSGYFYSQHHAQAADNLFNDPFRPPGHQQLLDGTEDAAFVSAFGASLKDYLRMAGVKV